jgi:bifunctional non-homologous end joining protein LigD
MGSIQGTRLRAAPVFFALLGQGPYISGMPDDSRRPMPAIIRTMQPTLAAAVPRSPGWVHEVKVDGWRIVARIAGGTARLTTRNGRDYTTAMAPIAVALAALPVREAIIDGEVAAPDERGVTRVGDVRGALAHPERLAYYAFDLLWLDGNDLRSLKLFVRKFRLDLLLRGVGAPLFYVEHVPAEQGQALYDKAVALGCEGIVSKRGESPYRSGETRHWLKFKPPEVRARQAAQVRAALEARRKR